MEEAADLKINEMPTAKEAVARLIEGQPESSSREEIIRELAFRLMLEYGLAYVDSKQTISNGETALYIRSRPR